MKVSKVIHCPSLKPCLASGERRAIMPVDMHYLLERSVYRQVSI